MTESIDTVRGVVTALGGATRVAHMTGRKPQHVVNWRNTGRFPASTFLSLSKALERIDKTAPAALWGMEELVEQETS